MIAEPSTVIERLISGFPVSMYLAMKATDATFITTQPTSAGSFPGGTRLPVAERTIIFSAPCGYFDLRAIILTEEAPLSFIRSRSARQTQFANAGRDCFFALELDDPRSCPFLPLGTRILVSGGDYAENGDIVIAKLRNPQALVFCRYLRDNDMIRLIPLNPEYPAMEWPNSENAEKVFWMYPVAEISIDLLNNKWKDGRLVLREDQETAD